MNAKPSRADRFPIGATVRLEDLAENPYPVFHTLRAREPVSWAGAIGMWLVTRRADAAAVLRDPETFSTESPRSPIAETFGPQMLSVDGERQRHYKKACAPSFSARNVMRDAAPLVEADARRRLDTLAAGGAAELGAEFAGPLAISTVTRILGLELDVDLVHRWSDDFAAALANFEGRIDVRARARISVEAFRRVVTERLSAPRLLPEGSLLASLTARSDSPPLGEDEIVSNALIILFGAIETTEALMLNLFWTVLDRPEIVRWVAASEAACDQAIEEVLRWEPPVQSCTRYVTRETSLGGVVLAPGEIVQCMIGAANRDPAHFDDPDAFDPRRPNAADHLSFGAGTHFCLGAALARLEARVSLRLLLERLPGLRLDPERRTSPYGHEFRKPPTLWVQWDR